MTTLAAIKIRRHRLSQDPKLTQEAFGARYGVAKHTVAGWETEGKRARPHVANRLARDGIVQHADWYAVGLCTACDAEGDSEAASACERRACPLRALKVA